MGGSRPTVALKGCHPDAPGRPPGFPKNSQSSCHMHGQRHSPRPPQAHNTHPYLAACPPVLAGEGAQEQGWGRRKRKGREERECLLRGVTVVPGSESKAGSGLGPET